MKERDLLALSLEELEQLARANSTDRALLANVRLQFMHRSAPEKAKNITNMIMALSSSPAPSKLVLSASTRLPELQTYCGLSRRPIFVPSVGNFRQGMLVSVPLHLDTLPGAPSAADLQAALESHYRGAALVRVVPADESAKLDGRLDALALNGTDKLELYVFANDAERQAVLVARLDKLGKGGAGAAVQNIKLMLGV